MVFDMSVHGVPLVKRSIAFPNIAFLNSVRYKVLDFRELGSLGASELRPWATLSALPKANRAGSRDGARSQSYLNA
ncbi:MAG: hypothetical protein F6K55_29145 [Moorea sp. SIO4A3]|nr:hypothetical protein [Moorena sp. SIO4A3]